MKEGEGDESQPRFMRRTRRRIQEKLSARLALLKGRGLKEGDSETPGSGS
jgi:hypothetical protein